MRNIRKRLGLGILSLALWAAAPVSAMAGQAGPGAVYQPSVNGINIYVKRKHSDPEPLQCCDRYMAG